jgi:hypothetical protein
MKFSKPLLVTKLKATALHLGISLLIFGYLAWQIYYNWYPEPYFSFDGGWQGMRLVAAVDLVLGPFITFLIFDLSKSRRAIIFDLVVIMIIQFGALAYGVVTTYIQRPVAIVLIDEFVISAVEEHYGNSLESTDQLTQFSQEHPPIIFADMPKTREGIAETMRIKIEDRILDHAQIRLYRPQSEFKDALDKLQPRFFRWLELADGYGRYEAWLALNQRSKEEVLIAKFGGRYGVAWLVFDREGKYLSYF